MFVEFVISQTVLFHREVKGQGQKSAETGRKCGVLFRSLRVAALCLFSSWTLKDRKKSQRKVRRTSTTWGRSWDVWKDTGTDAKKSQNKRRATSWPLRTIAACVWKLIGSATASLHPAEWEALFVATARTKAKQSRLLSPVCARPLEAGCWCTSIYWGSQQLLLSSALPTVGLCPSQQTVSCLMKWINEDYLK